MSHILELCTCLICIFCITCHVGIVEAELNWQENLQYFRNFRLKRSTCPSKFQHINGHTACLTNSKDASVKGMSKEDRDLVLNLHNEKRSSVNPVSTNMLKMTWDDEVASIAQKWAENCNFNHDGGYQRSVPGKFSVGQNLAKGHVSWEKAVNGWHNEVKYFNYGGDATGEIGHYTQMVWANSYKLGCGFAKCGQTGWTHYVCNYAPGGNFKPINKPYEIGAKSCGKCPDSCNNNLCDCGNKACYNGGSFVLTTCQCECKTKPFIYGSQCYLNCTDIKDTFFCGRTGFERDKCGDYANFPYDCPAMCQTCPYGGIYEDGPKEPGEASVTKPYKMITMFILTLVIHL